MVEIRHRTGGLVILDVDAPTLAGAHLAGANLMGADLRGSPRRFLHVALVGVASLLVALLCEGWAKFVVETLVVVGIGLLMDDVFCSAPAHRGDLHGANLRNACLVGADLSFTNLSGADLRGANLMGATLRWTTLKGAPYDQSTQWPTGFRLRWTGARPAPPERAGPSAEAPHPDREPELVATE